MCDHETMKLDRERYESETVFRGWQEDTDGTEFELRNHTCGSTLTDGTRRDIEIEMRRAA